RKVAHRRGKAHSHGRHSDARSPGTRPGRLHRGPVPSRRALVDGHQLAPPTGLRKSSIDARWDRRLGADSRSKSAVVLRKFLAASSWLLANEFAIASSQELSLITDCHIHI